MRIISSNNTKNKREWHERIDDKARLCSIVLILFLATLFAPFLPVQASYTYDLQYVSFVEEQLARQHAQITGENVELISKRKSNSKTYITPKGSYLSEFNAGDIHFKYNYADQYEPWKEIDTRIVGGEVYQHPFDIQMDQVNQTVAITDKKTGDYVVISIDKVQDKALNEYSKYSVAPVVSGNTITWTDLYTDTDVVIEVQSEQIKFKRILKSKYAPQDVVFNVDTKGGWIFRPYAEDADFKPLDLTWEYDDAFWFWQDDKLIETLGDVSKAKYPITIDPSITKQVSAGGDDASMRRDCSWFSSSINYGRVTYDQYDGYEYMRWDNVTIDQGATINSAKLQFYSLYNEADVPNFDPVIVGIDEDNVGAFTNCATCTGYNSTTANVTYPCDEGGGWQQNTWEDSPDISTIVKEIVDRVGWSNGNYMGMYVESANTQAGSFMYLCSNYDRNSAQAVKLVVDWSSAVSLPTVTNVGSSSVEETTATITGNITATGGENADIRGFVYDTSSHADPGNSSPPATYSDNVSFNGSFGTGTFNANLTGLTRGDLYYWRAYAHNSAGWEYSDNESEFLTKPDPPNSISATPGNQQLALTWNKGTGAQNTYIRYKQGSWPVDRTDGTLTYNNTGTSHTIPGLTNGLTYYIRAWSYATEGGYEQYSDDSDNCTGVPAAPPMTVNSLWFSGIGRDWMILNGRTSSDNTTNIGFDYGLTESYGSDLTISGDWDAGDIFTLAVRDLTPGTVYHWRAKANAGAGWVYGDDEDASTHNSPVLYEHHNTGGDGYTDNISMQYWEAEVFTTDNFTAHTVTDVRLPLRRTGSSPGTVTVSLRNTAGGLPTGVDLVSSTLNGNAMSSDNYTWYNFDFEETGLESDTAYAIVVRANDGNLTNYISWRNDSTSDNLSSTYAASSNDGGVTWTSDNTTDNLFEVWGNPAIEILDAKVWSGYKEDDDWLITCLYRNFYPPYYNTYDVEQYFYLQLLDGTTLLAQSTCRQWGVMPGSIYLNADEVTGLQWSDNYTVRLQGDFGAPQPYQEYMLVPLDWRGSDLTGLDAWCISMARLMEEETGNDYVVDVATKGSVLNESGGVYFSTGIPGLLYERPQIFQTSVTPIGNIDDDTRRTQNNPVWQSVVGPYVTQAFTYAGGTIGVTGRVIGDLVIFVIYAITALGGFRPGYTMGAVLISLPYFFLAFSLGFFEAGFFAVCLCVIVVVFTWKAVFQGG